MYDRLKDKKRVAVLGLGETGFQGALFLKERGYSVFVSDHQDSPALRERGRRLQAEKIPFELGSHTLPKIAGDDWVLISPGIPPNSGVYQALRKKGVPLVSEIEVASWFSPGRITAVTGTSGKTTVTTLLGRIFQANGVPRVVCGNIGNPWIGEIERITHDTEVVLEISSFQLEHTHSLRPSIAILLNIGLNHLDWHPDQTAYVAAKLRLFQNQRPGDFALVRKKDQSVFFPDFRFPGRVIHFDENPGKNANEQVLFEVTRIREFDREKTGALWSHFEGPEHRLERAGEVRGVEFVNDSKCTTLEALIWALEKYPDGRVILLAGGHAKGADFRRVRDLLHKKAKRAVVYGEAQKLLGESWEGACPLIPAKGLAEAFGEACKIAVPGDTVLLSPACASFDEFTNYEERGKKFKALVGTVGTCSESARLDLAEQQSKPGTFGTGTRQ